MRLLIDITFPELNLSYRFPEISIRQNPGGFEAEYFGPEMIIDQDDAMREMGLGNYMDLAKEAALAGKQEVLSGIARIAREGDRLLDVLTTGKNILPQIAKQYMISDIPELNVAAIPKTPPKIEMHYELKINWTRSKVDLSVQTYPVMTYCIPGKVDVSVAKGSKFDIRG
ncbi:MAG: hypothetical protein GX208_00180 [Firmicutes bacterium]|nr:hypothetical protein [Bacillota bacterium]